MPCSNAAQTQYPLKFVGVPQTPAPISAVSGPKFTILWGYVEEVLLLNKFFRLSIHALVAKIWPDKVVRWCRDADFGDFFASCISSETRAHVSDLHSKFTLECGPMSSLMVALPNIGGALCSTPQSLAYAHY